MPLILDVGLTPADGYQVSEEHDQHEAHEHHHDHDHEHHHDHHEHHSHHLENDGFVSISFESDRPFDVYKFDTFITEQMPENVFRAKGILWFSDSNLRHIFQLSGKRYTMDTLDWQKSPSTQLVLIGRQLDVAQIREQLNNCLVA